MTPQEQQLLTSLTQKINQTQLEEKDPDAENLLGRELGANPDAIYILAQTVLVQNIALDQAKAQIAQLQQQLQQSHPQPAHATSFLGRLLGEKDEPPPSPPPPQQGSGAWGGPQQAPPYQPVSQYGPPPPQYQQQYPPQQQYVPMQSSQPSFLRGAMQTAAGVAAGALAFEGVESILHGFGHGAGYGIGGMGMGGEFGRPVEETVVNNYYDEPRGGQDGLQGFEHDRPEGEHHHEGAQFSDTSGDLSGDDRRGFDDASNEDVAGLDDASGFDDGGSGFDDGGGFDDSGGNDLV